MGTVLDFPQRAYTAPQRGSQAALEGALSLSGDRTRSDEDERKDSPERVWPRGVSAVTLAWEASEGEISSGADGP